MAEGDKRSRRRRGVFLSTHGWRRLQDAEEEFAIQHNGGHAYTLEQLSELIGLSAKTLARVRRRKTPIDRTTLEEYFSAFGLKLEPSDYGSPDSLDTQAILTSANAAGVESPAPQSGAANVSHPMIDWGEAPDVSIFHGRIEELATLTSWIVDQPPVGHCRLAAVLGIGGVGKTAVAVKLVQKIQSDFEIVIWRSLSNAPPLETLLSEIIPLVSSQQETQLNYRIR